MLFSGQSWRHGSAKGTAGLGKGCRQRQTELCVEITPSSSDGGHQEQTRQFVFRWQGGGAYARHHVGGQEKRATKAGEHSPVHVTFCQNACRANAQRLVGSPGRVDPPGNHACPSRCLGTLRGEATELFGAIGLWFPWLASMPRRRHIFCLHYSALFGYLAPSPALAPVLLCLRSIGEPDVP